MARPISRGAAPNLEDSRPALGGSPRPNLEDSLGGFNIMHGSPRSGGGGPLRSSSVFSVSESLELGAAQQQPLASADMSFSVELADCCVCLESRAKTTACLECNAGAGGAEAVAAAAAAAAAAPTHFVCGECVGPMIGAACEPGAGYESAHLDADGRTSAEGELPCPLFRHGCGCVALQPSAIFAAIAGSEKVLGAYMGAVKRLERKRAVADHEAAQAALLATEERRRLEHDALEGDICCISDLISSLSLASCPGCGATNEKEHGDCNAMTCAECTRQFCFLCNADLSGEEIHAQFNVHKAAPARGMNPTGECFMWDADAEGLAPSETAQAALQLPAEVFRLRTQGAVNEYLGSLEQERRELVLLHCCERGMFEGIGNVYAFSISVDTDVVATAAEKAERLEQLGYVPGGLVNAAAAGDLCRVVALLEAGLEPDNVAEVLNHEESSECTKMTAVMWAVHHHHTDVARVLLDDGARVDARAGNGSTALHFAAEEGHTELISLLLLHGADASLAGVDGMTALHFAAERGDLEASAALLEGDAKPEATDRHGCTALHLAAGHGHVPVLAELLEHCADCEKRSKNGWTALHYAAWHSQPSSIKQLATAGVNIEARAQRGVYGKHDLRGPTALHIACELWSPGEPGCKEEDCASCACAESEERPPPRAQRLTTVRALLAAGADAEATVSGRAGHTALAYAEQNGFGEVADVLRRAMLYPKHFDGAAVYTRGDLAAAVRCGSVPRVRALLRTGASPNSPGERCGCGRAGCECCPCLSPLLWACHKSHAAMATILLEAHADIHAEALTSGSLPLHMAAETGSRAIVEALLVRGAAVDARTRKGGTALLLAAKNGHVAAARALLARGADIDAEQTKTGATALFKAAEYDRPRVLRLLLQHGAMTELRYKGQFTALHTAAIKDHDEVSRTLLEYGAGLEAVDRDGFTALMHASHRSHVFSISVLLSAGADVNACTAPPPPAAAETALTLALAPLKKGGGGAAADSRRLESVQQLLEAGARPDAKVGGGKSAMEICAESLTADAGERNRLAAVFELLKSFL